MTETYDLTNPLTDALGDEHTLREVTMTNHSTMTRIETLTNTEIPAGQTVLVRVLGDIGHEQLISQIQQINELKGFEVIGVSSVAVADETSGNESIFPTLFQAVETNKQLIYTSGDLTAAGEAPSFGYVAIKPMLEAERLRIIVPELSPNQEIKFLLNIQSTVIMAISDACVSIIDNGESTIVRTTNHEFIAQPGTILGIRRDGNKLIAETASDDSTSPANLDVVIDAYLHVVGSNSASSDVPALQIHAPSGPEE